jgi:hypothetical protein
VCADGRSASLKDEFGLPLPAGTFFVVNDTASSATLPHWLVLPGLSTLRPDACLAISSFASASHCMPMPVQPPAWRVFQAVRQTAPLVNLLCIVGDPFAGSACLRDLLMQLAAFHY